MKPALIFDMDGVIVDNTAYQARAFQLLFRDLGLTTNARQLLKRLNGMPATDILKSVFRLPVPPRQLKEYAAQREFLYRTLYWSKRLEMPGLSNFLRAARAAGHPVGLGTGSGGPTVSYIIDHLGLRRYFDVVVGEDDISQGKPHPDTFAVVAQKLGALPADCIVFEDALLGEQAAYRAGMRCVAITSSLPASAFRSPLIAVRNFTELTLPDLLTAWAVQSTTPRALRSQRATG